MIHNLATNGEKNELFVVLDIAIRLKRLEEVFQLFDRTMLVWDPQTQISVIDVVLSVTGLGKAEYQSKAIQWLRDNNKINQYIEEAIECFPKR